MDSAAAFFAIQRVFVDRLSCAMPEAAALQRKNTCKRLGKYGQNLAGKWVRRTAFREVDYDPENPDRLREFAGFDDAFAFDEKCRLDGTGGRGVLHHNIPKESVPREQLALEQSVKHAIKKDGTCTGIPTCPLSHWSTGPLSTGTRAVVPVYLPVHCRTAPLVHWSIVHCPLVHVL